MDKGKFLGGSNQGNKKDTLTNTFPHVWMVEYLSRCLFSGYMKKRNDMNIPFAVQEGSWGYLWAGGRLGPNEWII